MFYLNSYSLDELGLKMRNVYILSMLLSSAMYYVAVQESLPYWNIWVFPGICAFFSILFFLGKNSYGKRKQDYVFLESNPLILWTSLIIFWASPFLFIYAINYMPGELLQKIGLSFFANIVIGAISFKIIFPGELSRNHATEYRHTAVATKIIEKENTGKMTPSIKAEAKLRINTSDIDEDEKAKESEANIENLLKEQEELLKFNEKK